MLLLGAVIYVTAMTAYGMLISTFAKTQIAALFGTAILTMLPAAQLSGILSRLPTLTRVAQYIGLGFPMSYFVPISVGTFIKGLGFNDLTLDLVELAVFGPVLIGLIPTAAKGDSPAIPIEAKVRFTATETVRCCAGEG